MDDDELREGVEYHYDEDGDWVGYVEHLPNGDVITFDTDGDRDGAYLAEHGEWFPADEVTFGDEDPDPYDQLDQRMADLEARAGEERPPNYVPIYQQPPLTQQQLSDDVNQQGADMSAMLDRPLLMREQRALIGKVEEAAVAGERRPDLFAAAELLQATGRPLLDLDDPNPHRARQARQQFMAERLNDRERVEQAPYTGDDLRSDQAPGDGAYNPNDRADRQRYMLHRLEGRADPGDLYQPGFYGGEDASLG